MPSDMEMRMALVEKEQAEFHEVITDIRDILEKLVRLEERHTESREALGRAFVELQANRKDIDAIKIALPPLQETRKWVVSGIIGLVGMVLVALVGMVIINPSAVNQQQGTQHAQQ